MLTKSLAALALSQLPGVIGNGTDFVCLRQCGQYLQVFIHLSEQPFFIFRCVRLELRMFRFMGRFHDIAKNTKTNGTEQQAADDGNDRNAAQLFCQFLLVHTSLLHRKPPVLSLSFPSKAIRHSLFFSYVRLF